MHRSLENTHAGDTMNPRNPNNYKKNHTPPSDAPHLEWADRIIALAQGNLPEEDIAETREHLNTCPACSKSFDTYSHVIAITRGVPKMDRSPDIFQAKMPERIPPRLSQLLDDYEQGKIIPAGPPEVVPIAAREGRAREKAGAALQGAEHVSRPSKTSPHKRNKPAPGHVIAPPTPVRSGLYANSLLGNYHVMTIEGTIGPFQRYIGELIAHPTPVEMHIVSAPLPSTEQGQFLKEAKRLKRLRHRNIVPVIDYGVEGQTAYLVLNYIPADTMQEKYQSDLPLAPETVVSYVQQIAAALTYAHNQDIVHGNIKPKNLLVRSEGNVLVTHFDLSLSSLSGVEKPSEEAEPPLYTAPEQFRGESGPASDQYSLAAITYEWLTGSPLFSGAFFAEIAEHQQHSKPIPPRKKRPMLPVGLDRVMLKALSKHPADRYPDVKAFADDLAQVILEPSASAARVAETIETYAPPEPPINPKKDDQKDDPGASAVIYDGHSGPVLAVAWSTRGQHIASGGVDGTIQVWDAQHGKEVRRYTHHHEEEITALSWAMGKDLLASASNDGDVHIWEPQSGKRATTYTSYPKSLTTVAWSPTNDFLACGGDDHTVHVWRAGESQPLFIYDGHAKPLSGLVWSPDGKWIASADTGGMVHVWKVDSTTKQPMVAYIERKKSVLALAWSPNGTRIASGGSDTRIDIWKADNGAAVFSYKGHTSTVSALDWSPDGKYIASGDHNGAIHVWAAHTGEPFMTLPNVHTKGITGLAWSPAHNNLLASSSFDGTAVRWKILPLQA